MANGIIESLKRFRLLRMLGSKVKYAGEITRRLFTRRPAFLFFSWKSAYKRALIVPDSPDRTAPANIQKYVTNGLTYHQNVLSFPFKRGRSKDYAGGLIDIKTGNLVEESLYLNYRKTLSQELPDTALPELFNGNLHEISQPVLFGGLFWNNFGHFLLESLSRLWAYDHVRSLDPYILFYLEWVPPQYLDKKNYAFQVLSGFNIPHKRILFTEQPVKINNVLVPLQKYGYVYCKNPDATFMQFIRKFKFPRVVPKGFEHADKIYISRSKIPDGAGKPLGEKLFDDYLEANGYAIFHPQYYDLYQQLTLYSRAKKIIFCDGGALHGCILLPDLEAEVAVVARRVDPEYDCREILDQFIGYKKDVLWIDAVKEQYQYGLPSWDAVARVDWFEVSVQLTAKGFTEHVFDNFHNQNFQAIISRELQGHIKAVEHKPGFVNNPLQQPGREASV